MFCKKKILIFMQYVIQDSPKSVFTMYHFSLKMRTAAIYRTYYGEPKLAFPLSEKSPSNHNLDVETIPCVTGFSYNVNVK